MRHLRTYLLVALLLLLAAGQGVWAQSNSATTKTVIYRITGATDNGNDSYTLTFGLASGSETPYGSFTSSSVTVDKLTATDQTVTLGDGFSLRLQWAQGNPVNIYDNGHGWNINSPGGSITYTVKSVSAKYFVTGFRMMNNSGSTGMSDTGGQPIIPTYNYVCPLEQSYDSPGSFGRLEVTYTDAPPITLLTSPGADTYNVTSQRDLAVLAAYVNGGGDTGSLTFFQTTDINFTFTTGWDDASNEENNYTAIGTSSHPFQGTFDGQGHAIWGIRLYQGGNNSVDDYQGLFGCIGSGGTVMRVRLENARITGRNSVGGIAGGLFSATVEDCILSSVCIHSVQNSSSHGGIVGYSEGTIQRCISRATLSAANTGNCEGYGAIVGQNLNSVIDCIAVNATVAGVGKAGAIIGYQNSTAGTILRNYYRACTVAGTETATGVGVGYTSSNTSPHDITTNQGALALYSLTLPATDVTLVRTASTSLPGGKTYYTGADIGGTPYAYATATLTISYTGAPPDDGYNRVVYVNDVPATDNGDGTFTATMPAEDATVTPSQVAVPWRGNGTADSPWLIERPNQLELLATNVNGGNDYSGKYFLQTVNLVYDGTSNNYVPIGGVDISQSGHNNGDTPPPPAPIYSPRSGETIGGTTSAFRGTYDGGGNTIRGISFNNDGADYVGLFGYISEGGTVQNIVLENSYFIGKNYVGGIAGLNVGTIRSCHVKESVTITNGTQETLVAWNHGGIAGFVENHGSVIGCISATSVSNNGLEMGGQYGGIAGGIAGDGYHNGLIRDCLYTGSTVLAHKNYGAIVGAMLSLRAVLINNYYTSTSAPGGLMGSDADGAVLAAAYNSLPAEIGAQTASYANGLTAYEHGLSYQGVYYMSNSTVALTLAQGTKDGVTAWWGTFYYQRIRYALPEGAAAYTMDSYHHLYRLGTDGRTIPKNTAVVIIADKQNITLTYDDSSSEIVIHGGDNQLQGSDSVVKVSSGKVSGKTPYVLGVIGGEVGFYPLASDYNEVIPAHKAYYVE